MEVLDIKGFSATALSISAVAAQTAALNKGVYEIWADVDCYIKVATTADDVTAADGYKLFAGNSVPILIGQGDKIGAITGGASSELHYHRIGRGDVI